MDVSLQSEAMLRVNDLSVVFSTPEGRLRAVDRVSFHVPRGGTLCLVGESGCGKTVTSLAIMGLLPKPIAAVEAGEILFDGVDLLRLDEEERRRIRGDQMSMIFQEPTTALNPVMTVETQVAEVLRVHRDLNRREAREQVIELIRLVGIPDAEKRLAAYPHQLSVGMKQRVLIAMALACRPRLLVADEPTTALDVTVQAQILDLLHRLQTDLRMSLLLVTHDLGIVAEIESLVAVMYAGQIAELAPVGPLFEEPFHPYTRGLLDSIPGAQAAQGGRLKAIPGKVPDLHSLPGGCRFADRCSQAFDRCRIEEPPIYAMGDRLARCFLCESRGRRP